MFNRKKAKYISVIFVIIIICLLVACTNSQYSTEHEKIAAEYLVSKKYKIISNIGMTEEYVLDKEKVIKNPYHIAWGVQSNSPDNFFNKTIKTYSFLVENHPLEDIGLKMDRDYAVQVNVILSEKEVIGGTSALIPKDDSVLFGGIYSVDGKSLEEITGLSYAEWTKYWESKYGKQS